MAIQALSPVQPDPALAFREIHPEVKQIPAVKSVESTTNQAEKANQQYPQDADQKVRQRQHQLAERLIGANSELSISIDKATKKIVVKILNSETKEVIRQIPPKQLPNLLEGIHDLSGALFNDVA